MAVTDYYLGVMGITHMQSCQFFSSYACTLPIKLEIGPIALVVAETIISFPCFPFKLWELGAQNDLL